MMLSTRNVCWSAGGVEILRNVSLDVKEGEFLGIIGPNGSGKTSFLSLLSGVRRSRSGEVKLCGKSIQKFNRREIARKLALVEQQAGTTDRITARQAVELGRTPYLGAFSLGQNKTMPLLIAPCITSIWHIWQIVTGKRFQVESVSACILPVL